MGGLGTEGRVIAQAGWTRHKDGEIPGIYFLDGREKKPFSLSGLPSP